MKNFHGIRISRQGFTLVELLVAMAVLAVIMLILVSMVDATASIWGKTRSKIEQFQQARAAYDVLTRRLSEATLNPYYDYENTAGDRRDVANSATFIPARYTRQSDLRFISGLSSKLMNEPSASSHAVFFQAPQGWQPDMRGMVNLLNTCGFWVELNTDGAYLPSVLPGTFARQRFRLMQLLQPSKDLSVYGRTAGTPTSNKYDGKEWYQDALAVNTNKAVVAENIIALVMLPMLTPQDLQQLGTGYSASSLAPNYLYDSSGKDMSTQVADRNINPKHQLPPVMLVTMVAIDEVSANRMTDDDRTSLKQFIDSRFASAGNITNAQQAGYAKDLKELEDELVRRKLNYRIFSSNVALKAAKWSRE